MQARSKSTCGFPVRRPFRLVSTEWIRLQNKNSSPPTRRSMRFAISLSLTHSPISRWKVLRKLAQMEKKPLTAPPAIREIIPPRSTWKRSCQRGLRDNPNDGERFAQIALANSRGYPPRFPVDVRLDVRLCSCAHARAESERRTSGRGAGRERRAGPACPSRCRVKHILHDSPGNGR